jgi:glycosyltransferase involved in cell wall biosynthesis
MKVAHLIDALGWGGAQTLLLTFAKTARQFDVETVIIGVKPDPTHSPLPEMLKEAGAQVVIYSFTKLYDPRAVPTIADFLKKERVDVIQTHLSHANIYGCMAGKLANIPSIATLHNTKARSQGRTGMRQSVEHFCLRNGATRVIAVGQNVATAFSKVIEQERMDIIPNAVTPGIVISPDERTALRAGLVGDPARPLLIAVGRLTGQKGYDDMIAAFAQAAKPHPDAALVIVGTGELESNLRQQAASLGLAKKVYFTGSRSDVPRLLAASDIYLNTSHWEGLSIAMLEAMAAGLPVVATRVGDAEKLLSNGGGLLVEARSVEAFAAALTRLLDSPQDRLTMGQTARQFVDANYAARPWFEKLLNTYARAQEGLS